ncbi:MAG: hypothetical protein ABJB85_08020 [Nitrososphaerota archaeon]
MNKQANISISRYNISSKTLAACVITTGILLLMMSAATSMSEHSTNAQMMGDHGGFGNMTSGLHELQQKAKDNGTINLEQTIFKAIDSKINTSLTQAMTTAERSVGNNSFALAAFGGQYGGYFAYQIILGTPEMKFYIILVDPGNGQVLATQKVSAVELGKMHQEHSAEVVRNGSGGDVGFPFLMPH